MKKILKIALCALMVVGLAACGGESTDAQKKVVDNFFAYLKEGDLDKVSTICTGDDANLGSFTTMAQDYVNDNKDELVKLYQSDKSAYLDKVFGYVAPKIYGAMMEKVKAVQPEDVTTKITLTKDGDNWKISKID